MRFNDVVRVLDALDAKGVDYWVGGGWGIAILVGSQTRAHRDLDLAIKTEDLDDCLESLKGRICDRERLAPRARRIDCLRPAASRRTPRCP